MSAIQKGRYNLSEWERKKRKQRRRIERDWKFFYNEALPDPKPNWLDRHGNDVVNIVCALALVGMTAYLFHKVITME